jgi:DNA-directed RNA polymerase subunit M/transcription elongation factor TFIIS
MSVCDSCGNLLDVKAKTDDEKKSKKKMKAVFFCPTCGKEENVHPGTVIYTSFYQSGGEESGIDPEMIVADPTNEETIYLQCSNSKCKASKNGENNKFDYAFTVYKHIANGHVYYICQQCLTIVPT